MTRAVALTFTFAAALAVGGCTVLEQQRRESLLNAVRDYNDGLRWARIDQSARNLPLAQRKPWADKAGTQGVTLGDDLEVVDYEVQRMEFHPDNKVADVQVDLTWSLKQRGLVEKTVIRQRWEKSPLSNGGGRWVLTKQDRLKGSPLALLE
jgi:hypothetical protein